MIKATIVKPFKCFWSLAVLDLWILTKNIRTRVTNVGNRASIRRKMLGLPSQNVSYTWITIAPLIPRKPWQEKKSEWQCKIPHAKAGQS